MHQRKATIILLMMLFIVISLTNISFGDNGDITLDSLKEFTEGGTGGELQNSFFNKNSAGKFVDSSGNELFQWRDSNMNNNEQRVNGETYILLTETDEKGKWLTFTEYKKIYGITNISNYIKVSKRDSEGNIIYGNDGKPVIENISLSNYNSVNIKGTKLVIPLTMYITNNNHANTINNTTDTNASFQKLVVFINKTLQYAVSFGVLSAIIVFIIHMIKLSYLPAHPIKRRAAILNIMTSVISIFLLGNVNVLLFFLSDLLNKVVASGLSVIKDWEVMIVILLGEYRNIIVGIFGLATLVMVLMFTVSAMQLGMSGDSPRGRQSAIMKLFLTAVATIGLGGTTLLVGLFMNM